MKRILALIVVLLTAIITMAYLYFSGLSTEKKNNDIALYAATANSSLVLAFQNDKSILDILSSQILLQQVMSDEKLSQLKSLDHFLSKNAGLFHLTEKQNVYISLMPGKDKNIDFLFFTQMNPKLDTGMLAGALKSADIETTTSTGGITRIVLGDSSAFYFNLKNHLITLSGSKDAVATQMKLRADKTSKFAEYVLATSKLNKNSLSELYVNFNTFPHLLSAVLPGKLSGELALLNHQNAFATLTYSYGNSNLLLNGTIKINDPENYYQLFVGDPGMKTSINTILPKNTASYTSYTVDHYKKWQESLAVWFTKKQESNPTPARIRNIIANYHLDPEQLFPRYFKNQFITFQLSTGEKLGAVALSNGEKLQQLLLDLSSDYSEGIKAFKEPDILYAYFGDPFKRFKKPYYVITDNYIIFANTPSSLQNFLSNYRNNNLLINNSEYVKSTDQLPLTSGITFYVGLKANRKIALKTLYLPFYRHLTATGKMGSFTSFICQLNGEKDKFQTNMLLGKEAGIMNPDSSKILLDSLTMPR